jgi:hypothetical protein
MAVRRKFTIPELLDLADRMISRGTSDTLKDQPELKADCLACGMLLAHMVLRSVIQEAIVLGGSEDNSSPPFVPR